MIITTHFQQQFNYINPQELQQKLANNSGLLKKYFGEGRYQASGVRFQVKCL